MHIPSLKEGVGTEARPAAPARRRSTREGAPMNAPGRATIYGGADKAKDDTGYPALA